MRPSDPILTLVRAKATGSLSMRWRNQTWRTLVCLRDIIFGNFGIGYIRCCEPANDSARSAHVVRARSTERLDAADRARTRRTARRTGRISMGRIPGWKKVGGNVTSVGVCHKFCPEDKTGVSTNRLLAHQSPVRMRKSLGGRITMTTDCFMQFPEGYASMTVLQAWTEEMRKRSCKILISRVLTVPGFDLLLLPQRCLEKFRCGIIGEFAIQWVVEGNGFSGIVRVVLSRGLSGRCRLSDQCPAFSRRKWDVAFSPIPGNPCRR